MVYFVLIVIEFTDLQKDGSEQNHSAENEKTTLQGHRLSASPRINQRCGKGANQRASYKLGPGNGRGGTRQDSDTFCQYRNGTGKNNAYFPPFIEEGGSGNTIIRREESAKSAIASAS